MHFIRRYIIAGLLIWLPIIVTLIVLRFIAGIFGSVFSLFPQDSQPDRLFGYYIPGLSLFISILVIFFTGMLVTNFLGRRLVLVWEKMVNRIPIVRSIYTGTKQMAETLFSSSSNSFKKVFLIEYPRKGLWSLAFQTGTSSNEINQLTGQEMLAVFIPTTPNPTSGFLILVPSADAIELDMSVDQALKFIISLGVMQPTPELITTKSN